jgi:hypothetical protein
LSLFTEPVDKYFVVKLASGLVLFFAGCYVVLALFAWAGWPHPRAIAPGSQPWVVALAYGAMAAGALAVFRVASRAQARNREKG